MRSLCLLFVLATTLLSTACAAAPVTPIFVNVYPVTWTPEPTPTNTPRPPTATLVIQHTPGPAPTRDPNLRRIPNAPRGGIGVWLDAANIKPALLTALVPRVQIIVEPVDASNARPSGIFYFLKIDAAQGNASELAARYDGVLIENATQEKVTTLRAKVAPRLVLVEPILEQANVLAARIPDADGICFCNFLREIDTPRASFKIETDWKRDVDTLAALSSQPNTIVLTATRFPDDATEKFAPTQQWLDYAAASFLLGANTSYTFFGFQGKGAQEFLGAPAIAAQIGTPNGAMFKASGVYQRRFTRGLALVNPTNETRAFALARNYVTLNGTAITQLEMAPHSGMILLNVE